MVRTNTQGKSGGGRRDVPRPSFWEKKEKSLEARRDENYLRGPELHAEAPEVRAIYSSKRSAHEESTCHAPRAEGYVLFGYFGL